MTWDDFLGAAPSWPGATREQVGCDRRTMHAGAMPRWRLLMRMTVIGHYQVAERGPRGFSDEASVWPGGMREQPRGL